MTGLFASIGNAQDLVTLKEAIGLVMERNLKIKQAKLNEDLSLETVKQTKSSVYPSFFTSNNLFFYSGRSVDPSTNEFVSNSLLSTDGGVLMNFNLSRTIQNLNHIARSKYIHVSDQTSSQKLKNDLVLLVIDYYLTTLSKQDMLDVAEQQERHAQLQIKRGEKLIEAGKKTASSLLLLKSQLAESNLRVVTLQNQRDISFLNLAQLLEFDQSKKIKLERPYFADSLYLSGKNLNLTEMTRMGVTNSLEVKLAHLKTLISLENIKVARKGYYPVLSLQVGINTRFSNGTFTDRTFLNQINDNLSRSVGVNLNIPIANGNVAHSALRKAKIDHEYSLLNEELEVDLLIKTIHQTILDMRAAEKYYKSCKSALEVMQEAFVAMQKNFEYGLATFADYDQARININHAQFSEIEAKYNLIFKNVMVDYYLGGKISIY